MERILLSLSMAIGACSPSPRETAMTHAGAPQNGGISSGERAGGAQGQAAQGPVTEPVSAADTSAPVTTSDPSGDAAGRRILSTAFVRVGPDRLLTVGLHDGQTVVLRDVVMRATDYCGTRIVPGGKDRKYCGGYADVAAARPGGTAAPADATLSSDATGVMARPSETP